MDKYDVIDKARNALIQHLSNDERLMFAELTPEHQRYLVSWEARYLDNECPDGVSIEDCIQIDIDGCIERLQGVIRQLIDTEEGKEQWEEWLGLKSNIRDVLEIDRLIRLLFHPLDIRVAGENTGIHNSAGIALAGFFATEGYIEPYRYPWQTHLKKIIYKEAGLDLPDVRGWRQRDREHYFAELPIKIKMFAQIKINDLEAAAKQLPPGGWSHPAKMIPVWRSYLSAAHLPPESLHQPELPKPPKAKRNRQAAPLLESCLAVWRNLPDCQDVPPVTAIQLLKAVILKQGVAGYPDLRHSGSKIEWAEEDSLEMKHFKAAFERYYGR